MSYLVKHTMIGSTAYGGPWKQGDIVAADDLMPAGAEREALIQRLLDVGAIAPAG